MRRGLRLGADATKKELKDIVSFHIPVELLRSLDFLVERGLALNRSDAIRQAILFYTAEMMRFIDALDRAKRPKLSAKMMVG